MRRSHRALLIAALSLALSACATHPAMREPVQAQSPAPSVVTTNATTKSPRCIAGNGQVVRLTQIDPANDTATAMHGGVLGSVLDDGQAGGNAPATHAANGVRHDIYVQMDDGRKIIVSQRELGAIGMGSRVAVDAECRAHVLH